MRILRVSLLVILVLAALAYGGWRYLGGSVGIAARSLPAIPQRSDALDSLADGRSGEIVFASATPFDFEVLINDTAAAVPTSAMGTLSLPQDLDAPVPAMVIVHGSGGISPGREHEYARLLNANGIAALVLDYYTPRGATEDVNYMLRVTSVTEFDALMDSYRALALLRTHPAIDPARIGIMGFSYGGMVARFALDDRVHRALIGNQPGFALHVDFYGPCFQDLASPALTGGPILTLRGTADASNDLVACARREQQLRDAGIEVQTHIYEGAGHAWEVNRERAVSESSPYVSGCEMRYDEAGRPTVDGRMVVDVPLAAGRPERFVARMGSGSVLEGCVKYGYMIGRDDSTRARADIDLLAFLREKFLLPS